MNRFDTSKLLVVAFGSLTAGYALFLRLGESASYLSLILPTMIQLGISFAIGFPSLNVQAATGVADEEQGLASGVLNTSLQIGGAVGLAIVSAVVTRHTHGTSPAEVLQGFRPGILVSALVAVIGLLAAIVGWWRERAVAFEPYPEVAPSGELVGSPVG